MYSLVYVSSATQPFPKEALVTLLATSRERNSARGITGLLLFKDGNFMQVLEGAEADVRATYDKIARDVRHRGLLTLIQETREKREFSEWSMGFRDLSSTDLRETPGYSEFLNTPLTAAAFSAGAASCRRLLLTFKETMR